MGVERLYGGYEEMYAHERWSDVQGRGVGCSGEVVKSSSRRNKKKMGGRDVKQIDSEE